MSTGYSPKLGSGLVDDSKKAVTIAYNGAKVAGILGGVFLSMYLIIKTKQGIVKGHRYVSAKMKEAAKYRLRLVKE